MDRIAGEEDTLVFGKVRADSLADLIGGPPVAVLVCKLVWSHGALG